MSRKACAWTAVNSQTVHNTPPSAFDSTPSDVRTDQNPTTSIASSAAVFPPPADEPSGISGGTTLDSQPQVRPPPPSSFVLGSTRTPSPVPKRTKVAKTKPQPRSAPRVLLLAKVAKSMSTGNTHDSESHNQSLCWRLHHCEVSAPIGERTFDIFFIVLRDADSGRAYCRQYAYTRIHPENDELEDAFKEVRSAIAHLAVLNPNVTIMTHQDCHRIISEIRETAWHHISAFLSSRRETIPLRQHTGQGQFETVLRVGRGCRTGLSP